MWELLLFGHQFAKFGVPNFPYVQNNYGKAFRWLSIIVLFQRWYSWDSISFVWTLLSHSCKPFYLHCHPPRKVSWCEPGARFTNDFLPAIQIRWKLRLAVIPLSVIRSQQIFAHATTAQLSCHVQNFAAIAVLESRWEWNEISIEFELWWKNR